MPGRIIDTVAAQIANVTLPAPVTEVAVLTSPVTRIGTYARVSFCIEYSSGGDHGFLLRRGTDTTGTLLTSSGPGVDLLHKTYVDTAPVSQYTLTTFGDSSEADTALFINITVDQID